ncbi:MAG: hypothetical protein J0H62_11985, partial [Rhizobiales bacterium]|nr:hypothetical protein [Hyphomicrobiales bacterium]
MEDDGIVRYGYRPSLVAAPQDFAVEQSGLRWSIGRHSGLVPYAAIRRVRLAYRPVSLQLHRFTMEIWADAAPKLTVSSSSWRTMVEQQRQDAPYKAFVRALHDRIARSGAEPRLQAGLANFAFWPGAIVFAGMAIALPWMILKSARAD